MRGVGEDGGFVCFPQSIPSMSTENFSLALALPSAIANATLPPRLWPVSASLRRLGVTICGLSSLLLFPLI